MRTSSAAGKDLSLELLRRVEGRFLLSVAVCALFSACGGDTYVVVAAANVAPVAYGGVTQEVFVGYTVTLDGTGSSDANGDPLTYSWTLTKKPPGSAATLSGANTAKPTFVADVAGTYTATLTVSDGMQSSTSTGSANASVPNSAPAANAGPDQSVFSGATVTLDGSQSSDVNGDPTMFDWVLTSKPAGSTAALSNATSATPTFVADMAGTYIATLTVSDGQLSSAPDAVTITVAQSPWTADVSMPTPRGKVAAMTIGDLIYVLGGGTGGTPVATVEVFDTTQHTWSTAPAMPTARPSFAAAVVAGRIYTIGGGDGSGSGPTAIVEMFDPATGMWTTKAPMPTPRTRAAAAAIGGEIYVVGGYKLPTCIDWPCHAVAAVESYNVATDTWINRGDILQRIDPGAAALNDNLYVLGGEVQQGILIGGLTKAVDRYDPASGSWSTAAAMPNALRSPAVAVVGGKILVIATPLVEYDPIADAWTTKEAPSPGAAGLNFAVVAGKVYVFNATETLVYDPAKDKP
jgi:N-acetylneuraminic acid mutarotase